MLRKLLKSKIHRATVTHADLHYEGSISIPKGLMEVANIIDRESVHVWNVTAGSRFETYAIEGAGDESCISVNGAAARLVSPGDQIIIASFTWVDEDEARGFASSIVFVDDRNKITSRRNEVPGPLTPAR